MAVQWAKSHLVSAQSASNYAPSLRWRGEGAGTTGTHVRTRVADGGNKFIYKQFILGLFVRLCYVCFHECVMYVCVGVFVFI